MYSKNLKMKKWKSIHTLKEKNTWLWLKSQGISYSAFEILFTLQYNLDGIQLFHLLVSESISAWSQESSVYFSSEIIVGESYMCFPFLSSK